MKIIYYLYVFLWLIVGTSCNDKWLDPKPLSIYVPENIYVNKAGMESVLLTLRRGLRSEFYDSKSMLCTEIFSSDLAICGGEQAIDVHNYNTQVSPTASGDVAIMFNYWGTAYSQIRNANVIISRIDGAQWTSDQEKNAVLGEAYFHRAYWYYRLVHQFGDVPFISREHTAPKIDFYTNSRAAILNKIQSDLEFSVQWLPETVEPGKISQAAGYHLLTKVYLANNEFDKAIASASAVIDDGKHSLMTQRFGSVAGDDRFNVIWDLHQKENKSISTNMEGILVVQDKFGFPGAQTGGTNTMRNLTPFWSHGSYIKDPNGKQGMLSAQFLPQVLAFGRGVGHVVTTKYFNHEIWIGAGSDLRCDPDTNWMPTQKILYNNPTSEYFGQPVQIQYSNPRDTLRSYYPWPQYKIYVADELRPGIPTGGNADWYVFRLAETYLLRAEAYYWKNDFVNAASDINKVRERALAPPISPGDVTIEYILDERARELYYEEPRKTELTRIAFIMAEKNLNGYSIASFHEKNYWYDRVIAKTLYNTGLVWAANEYVISPYHVLWPVPQSEIDANPGGQINQNKGYQGSERNITPLNEIDNAQ